MRFVVILLLAMTATLAVARDVLTTQRVQNGRVISVGDSVRQVVQARPDWQKGGAYGWRIDRQRILWARVRDGRVTSLTIVYQPPKRRR